MSTAQNNNGGVFTLDANVPLPPKRRAGNDESKFPFADMAIDQSFQVIGNQLGNQARNAASSYSKAHAGYFFVSRTMGLDPTSGEDIVRIWRVASK